MDEVCLTVDTKELASLLETLPEGACLPLKVTGSSMSPFLKEGRDRVFLTPISRKLKVGDVVLYRRGNGAYILHRICRIRGSVYAMIGDAHDLREEGIGREQIIALAEKAERKGKLLRPGDGVWEFFAKVWARVIPLRPMLKRCYRAIRKSV